MPIYEKKPVRVEAYQMPLKQTDPAIPEDFFYASGNIRQWDMTDSGQLVIHTLEGDMVAQPGDWIIKGVKGELYPCKPDIFEETYELV